MMSVMKIEDGVIIATAVVVDDMYRNGVEVRRPQHQSTRRPEKW